MDYSKLKGFLLYFFALLYYNNFLSMLLGDNDPPPGGAPNFQFILEYARCYKFYMLAPNIF